MMRSNLSPTPHPPFSARRRGARSSAHPQILLPKKERRLAFSGIVGLSVAKGAQGGNDGASLGYVFLDETRLEVPSNADAVAVRLKPHLPTDVCS